MFSKNRKLLIGLGAFGVAVLAWLGAAAAWFFFDPSLAQWTMIVTVAALATELALWVGAAVLGITALQRVRNWMRLRRGA